MNAIIVRQNHQPVTTRGNRGISQLNTDCLFGRNSLRPRISLKRELILIDLYQRPLYQPPSAR
ncbi:MAG: hypothetical protein ABIK07_09665 [Planctomycetota bacterium]